MVAITNYNGPNFVNPQEFAKSIAAAANIKLLEAGGTARTSAVSNFFSVMSTIGGVADDTNWTADTYKTLLTVSSGIGLVASLVGPTGLAGTPTTTFEITVDGGTAVEVAVLQTTTGQRAYLGPAAPDTDYYTTAGEPFWQPNSGTSTVQLYSTRNCILPSMQAIRFHGIPCLIYRRSLLVRAKSSESNSTTTNQERQSAILHMRLA